MKRVSVNDRVALARAAFWGGNEALITSLERLDDALAGRTGTRITK